MIQATAGKWRLSSGQLGTHCLADKSPGCKVSLRVTCWGLCPRGPGMGGGSVLGRTSEPLTGFSGSESSELLITTTRSSEMEQGRWG